MLGSSKSKRIKHHMIDTFLSDFIIRKNGELRCVTHWLCWVQIFHLLEELQCWYKLMNVTSKDWKHDCTREEKRGMPEL